MNKSDKQSFNNKKRTANKPKPASTASGQATKMKNPILHTRPKYLKLYEKFQKREFVDTNDIVDESIVYFAVEFGQILGLRKEEMPNDPIKFCDNFGINVYNMFDGFENCSQYFK